MKIGNLELESNLCLSPLAGYTNLPFRLTAKTLGGLGLVTTDLVNARSLLEGRPVAYKMIATDAREQPMAVQLFGGVPEEMRDAAVIAEEHGAKSVDINMGCPVKKVVKTGSGSSLMRDQDKTRELVRGMIEAIKIPVTAKMRLGWDAENITAPDLAKSLEDIGVSAIFIHGRTRAQGFSGGVDLEGIRKVKEAVKSIPVIGNGDVTTAEAARVMLERTGCDGVSIGRGAFYNPWIFKQTKHYLETGELLADPSFEERVDLMRLHLERMIEFYGEVKGCIQFRKVAVWYAKRFGPSKYFKDRVVRVESMEHFEEILEGYREWRLRFCDENGELQDRYKPAAQYSSITDGAPEVSDAIKVPKGPVSNW
ncbi:tRNA dihydrouridine synthase DusB [Pelagicoccus sp. SDUM812003]|uniref:tRNA dihydrouridine synthase DusB n=1 Tax=Pelagicoccus sp. SDUM812003 TaxID=3041267 RepID=UPI00280FA5D4|nr:tRNA dihydrouridine synthase DusB [Pelagicoccus sp. SDUM812003]MDQ8201559.1 tRNA dihydrouridine synthase DusB [Pelagicoccus sp. SDUM812003]